MGRPDFARRYCSLAESADPVLVDEAEPEVEEAGDAGVDDAVPDVVAVPAGDEDLLVDEALKLVGHGLHAHSYGVGELADGQLAGPFERVQEPQAVLVGQDLEQSLELAGGRVVDQRSFSEGAVLCCFGG